MAVNYGMLKLNDLEMVEKDDVLANDLGALVAAKVVTADDASKIFPFYDHKYAPMDPVYCYVFPPEKSFAVNDDLIGDFSHFIKLCNNICFKY
jgi:hypothetical protein